MYDLDDDQKGEKKRKFFNLKICAARPGMSELVHLNFDPVEPEESKDGRFSFLPL